MISEETRRVYSEIDAFLDIIDNKKKEAIPLKIRNMFKKEKMQNYIPQYNSNVPIENQIKRRKTIAIIAQLHYSYWCENIEEKERLKELFSENETKYQKDINEKYSSDNLFKNKQKRVEDIQEKSITLIIEKKWYEKLFEKIRKILKK